MKVARIVLVVLFTIALQTTMSRFFTRGPIGVDLVFVVVIYAALTGGPVTGMLTGTLAGLVQDSLSTGILGIGGLAKTVVGFLTGVVGTQFIVVQPLPRAVVFAGATLLHAVLFYGLYALLDLRSFGTPYAATTGQVVGNAVVGVLTFQLIELVPGALERRRLHKSRPRR